MKCITGKVEELVNCRYIIFNRDPTIQELQYLMRDENIIKVIFVKKGNTWHEISGSSIIMTTIDEMMDKHKYGSIENYIRDLDRLLRIKLMQSPIRSKI